MTAVGKGWARRLSPLEMEVDCRGRRHRIRWVRGCVVAVDHDLFAERSLVALGGEPLPCMEMVRLSTGAADPRLLLRWNGRLVGGDNAPSRWPTHAAAWKLVTALSKSAPAMASAIRQHAVLAEQPAGLLDRIALGRVVALARHPSDDELETLDLALSVSLRAKPAIEASLHAWTRRPSHRLPLIECGLADPDQIASISGSWAEGYVVRLPPRWLPEVWAPGLAVVDGCFVLEVDRARGAAAEGRIVTWERAKAGDGMPVVRSARLHRSPSGWGLRLR